MERPGVQVVGLCDPDPDAVERLRQKLKMRVPSYAGLEELLQEVRPDVVDICTPGFLHAEQASAALEAGCHVLVEKPPVSNVSQALDLSALAAGRGRKLGALFNYRYRDLVMELKGAADSGLLGKLVKVNITHHGPLVFTDAPWLWDEARSKYLLWEFGLHFVDILVHLLGPAEEVLHVHAFEQPALGHTTDLDIAVRFAGGTVGKLEITADTTRHSSALTRIDAYGTAQDAFVRWFPPQIRFRASTDNPLGIIGDELRSAWFVANKLLRNQFTRHRNISHYRVINAFADWVAGGEEYPLTFDRIVPTIELLCEIEKRVPSYSRATGCAASAD
jgi:predicted dehydrogenase